MSERQQRCVLVRHGETEWSLDGRHTGRTDLPLLPEGAAQARALRPLLDGRPFALVLTSPLARAKETCRLAGFGSTAVEDPDLVEWDYGRYEGLTTPSIREHRPGWRLFEDGAAGGESAADVGARVDRLIERIRAADGDTVCFSHSHLLRVLAARWVGLGPDVGRVFAMAPASCSELGWDREQPTVVTWNQVLR